jgi:hypothetical protein
MTIWGNIIMSKRFLGLLLATACVCAQAQFIAQDPDWKESDVPPPPAFKIERLLEVVISRQSQLIWGVDQDSIKITPDGVVRYVVVARSPSGALNAMYEGLLCRKGEVITYARFNRDSGWSNVSSREWKSFRALGQAAHSWRLAKEGLCDGAAPPTTVADAIRKLREADKSP